MWLSSLLRKQRRSVPSGRNRGQSAQLSATAPPNPIAPTAADSRPVSRPGHARAGQAADVSGSVFIVPINIGDGSIASRI